jgi:hypothetical protein
MEKSKFRAYAEAELKGIEDSLKEWFLTRRFRLERALAIKEQLDENNFVGLSLNNSHISQKDALMWKDLVVGKPSVEAALSHDAQTRKVETYVEIFDKATDGDHVCRGSGMTFLRCLGHHKVEASKNCASEFEKFDACRASIIAQQRDAVDNKLVQQDIEDKRAKSLFERRMVLIDTLNATETTAAGSKQH